LVRGVGIEPNVVGAHTATLPNRTDGRSWLSRTVFYRCSGEHRTNRLAGAFAVVMLGIALYCVGRLIAARRTGRLIERDVDVVHVGMGTAMAGMLAPSANPLAGHAWDLGWTMFFGLAVCWFGARMLIALAEARPAGSAPAHLLGSGVMLYMMSATPAASAMPGMDMGGMSGASVTTPVLTLILLGLLGGFAVLAGGSRAAPGRRGGRGERAAGAQGRRLLSHRDERHHGLDAAADALKSMT
jgi:hypothetical protein